MTDPIVFLPMSDEEFLPKFARWLQRGPKAPVQKFGRKPRTQSLEEFVAFTTKQREVKKALSAQERTYAAKGAE